MRDATELSGNRWHGWRFRCDPNDVDNMTAVDLLTWPWALAAGAGAAGVNTPGWMVEVSGQNSDGHNWRFTVVRDIPYREAAAIARGIVKTYREMGGG
ncbi:MAG: hypothetical protein IPH08_04110 [Rhodocyclaceae bacterium]|nr:hypothetical protein [Rhodocyclaceae bacterium]